MSRPIDPSMYMAEAICEYCLNQERREDSAEMTVCFDLSAEVIRNVIEAAFNLSVETHEARPIVGGFILARDGPALLEQVKTWRVAILNLDVERLSYDAIKHVAAVLTRDTWAVVCPLGQGFRVVGLMRQRRVPLHETQSGSARQRIWDHPPLAVSIEGPGIITASVYHELIAARRGDDVWGNAMTDPLLFVALARCTGGWGDPGQTAALFNGVRRQIEMERRGGTIVIGPRVDTQDRSVIQAGAIQVSGLNVSGVVTSDFPRAMDIDRFAAEPLKEYRQYELARERGEELRDLLVTMTAADGAVLIDEAGEVYAYHAFFAVPAGGQELKGEGSRHRTLRAFVACTKSWMAFAVSQDGTATVLAWDPDADRLVETHSRHGIWLRAEIET
jgi:hypothetical protein